MAIRAACAEHFLSVGERESVEVQLLRCIVSDVACGWGCLQMLFG
jgi:hypothetical protein